ncbi:VOC family protein [Mycobacterium sp. AZCC_0083]|uniref:VOC family protein n=1 Tax=Mycobacterium sp. AZCC_0083 TaxID=2735882 RepID=UPI00160C9DD7|nr:VOC family protein [Mycobacterium sp. AZCC_0083]MBB5165356.1 catechol 2,3-dioxygenase-like lactoylglutathione lyase family enzyme [Mycobacterium sp. AZCC_0083]
MTTDNQQPGAAVSAPGRGLGSLAFACTVIVVADLDRSQQWYQSILGFTEVARVRIDGANVVLLEGAGTQLELIEGDGPTVSTEPRLCADPPHHLLPRGNKFLAFAVDDLTRATDQLRDKGVPIIWRDKQLAPGIRSTAIRDVEDNFIHIVQH